MKATDLGRYIRRFIYKDGEVSLTKEFEAEMLRYYRNLKPSETDEAIEQFVHEMGEYHKRMYLSIRFNDLNKMTRFLMDFEFYECDGFCQRCIHNGNCASQKYAEEIRNKEL